MKTKSNQVEVHYISWGNITNDFSRGLWKEVLMLCEEPREVNSWREEVEWAIKRLKGKSLKSVILRVAWNAVVYFTWIERNKRIYQDKEGTLMQVMEQIKEVVRIRLIGLQHVKFDSLNFTLYSSWSLKQSIFD